MSVSGNWYEAATTARRRRRRASPPLPSLSFPFFHFSSLHTRCAWAQVGSTYSYYDASFQCRRMPSQQNIPVQYRPCKSIPLIGLKSTVPNHPTSQPHSAVEAVIRPRDYCFPFLYPTQRYKLPYSPLSPPAKKPQSNQIFPSLPKRNQSRAGNINVCNATEECLIPPSFPQCQHSFDRTPCWWWWGIHGVSKLCSVKSNKPTIH